MSLVDSLIHETVVVDSDVGAASVVSPVDVGSVGLCGEVCCSV